ncbi:extensin family protein [Alteraurantiacibacter palmitatis]|uniref:Extensin family protein n=1 Tax=Alteraurantiacibacter palmitatis TaxID=2054628 RepID=A0ABV7E9S3_9SPHN
MKKIISVLIASALLSACTVVPESNRASTARSTAPASSGAVATRLPAPVAAHPQDRQCLAQLTDTGAQFVPVADAYLGEGCSTVGTVQLSALRSDATRLSLSNMGPVQCGVGAAFAAWARYGVDRAAQQILGSPLQRIETMGSYACRNVAGSSRRSAHATAGAIDIAAFVLEDGRRISVLQHWHGGSAAEKEFLRTVQRSACRRFATVLGPEYNAAHRDHFHLEGVMGDSSFCR